MSTTKNHVARLKRAGFDRTCSVNHQIYPRCSQCQAMCINGTACHERGCPNEKRRMREDD